MAKKHGPNPAHALRLGPPSVDARPHPATMVTATYDPDEAEYMAAVQAFKARTGRQYPTCSDFLAIAKSLGYGRTPAASSLTEGR